jgi:hypothetical protein
MTENENNRAVKGKRSWYECEFIYPSMSVRKGGKFSSLEKAEHNIFITERDDNHWLEVKIHAMSDMVIRHETR